MTKTPPSPGSGRVASWASLAAVLLIALAASAASAQDIDAAREAFRRGNEAYNAADYEAAIQHFQEANGIAPNARLLLYIGQSYMHLGRGADAIGFLRQYADSSSEAASEVRDILRELEQAQNEVFTVAQRAVDAAWRLAGGQPPASSQQTTDWTGIPVVPIQIRSEPSGAEVYVDDESLGSVGRTPLVTELFAGPHHIIIKAPNFRTHRERVDLQRSAGSSVAVVNARLERANVQVEISTNPVTAHAFYLTSAGDTIDLGSGSFRGELPAGPGVFILQRSGQSRRIERTLDDASGVVRLTLNLNASDDREQAGEADIGTLTIRSSQAGVVITIDGTEVGRGEGEFETRQPGGLHTIRVEKSGHETVIENLRVYPGERASWTVPRMYPNR